MQNDHNHFLIGADPLLVYSTGKEVRGIRLRSNEFFLVATAVVHISAVDVDPKIKRVYWIDVSNRSTIYTAKTDGSDLRSVLSHGEFYKRRKIVYCSSFLHLLSF